MSLTPTEFIWIAIPVESLDMASMVWVDSQWKGLRIDKKLKKYLKLGKIEVA